MIIQPLRKIREKLGRFFVPLVFLIFFIFMIGLVFSSVQQRAVDYKEGQVAESSIRANKTIENTSATEQKRKIAAEAVIPEYTYQEDMAKKQHEMIQHLFQLIEKVKEDSEVENKKREASAKDNQEVQKVTVDEQIAALKKEFEQIDADDLSFYQRVSNTFFQLVFSMSSDALNTVENESLALIDEQMNKQVRQANLAETRKTAEDKIELLNVTSNQAQAIRLMINQGIVVNTFLNERKTQDLQQAAKEAVQPVMIYQGEIIVREGSQIDANAIEKLNLLGMTSSNASLFPMVALVMAILLQIVVLLYFVKQWTDREKRENYLTFYAITMILSVLVMKFFQVFQTETMPFIPLFYPAAFVPLVLSLFLNRRLGILAAAFQVVTATFIFYQSIGTNILTIILVSYMFSGIMGTVLARKRIVDQGMKALMWVVIFPFLINLILVIFQGMSFSNGRTWIALACGLAGSIFSLLLTIGLHQYIELLITDDSVIILNELSNPNHPLLKQLLEEAPGTYHHSMMVANLSANAVAEIGGHSLLTRVACYYHDIGKLKHANFFVENLPAGAENPHNFLLPADSKQIIFGHVIDGAALLEEKNMPQMVIDICRQHHGTTLMKFFYVKAQERNPDVTEAEYRYPGPIPQTREAAVVSIADSCEAAVRAMENPTNEKIRQFVSNLITGRILDGQLDDSGLTLKEIRIIENSLVNGLCSTFHSRIKYPKMKSEAEKMKEEQERREE
ncbi:HD family phosphohydrolase [Enterococcus saccharolyticus]|uniref:HD protein n=1 Tax=Enterococcus saccharolyticus subsp. saccharolyticus ATCC 43076 TaxID=1139996 RepID=S0JB69_9ENTE|nr:HDIG domain-containing metalloprotein [Enterococcus saccharolyticus]EOT30154.1 HD protein [Enterococcus saccharolyticus subsp. saccharolyticus ATCC 43076]EOT80699.1 HD protein [Enterococcus saccharolyticus subsp. saccharolyticus ATCC 43076]OJG87847.1 HD protein [Enterococcus saccharolyticus]